MKRRALVFIDMLWLYKQRQPAKWHNIKCVNITTHEQIVSSTLKLIINTASLKGSYSQEWLKRGKTRIGVV